MPRVLAMDDDPYFRLVIDRVLASAGIEAVVAESGAEGLRKARENPPDVILCDLEMPGMDGFEVLAEVRKEAAMVSIPFVFVTGAATEAEEERMLRSGAAAVLRKPLAFAPLLAAVKSLLPAPPPSDGQPPPTR